MDYFLEKLVIGKVWYESNTMIIHVGRGSLTSKDSETLSAGYRDILIFTKLEYTALESKVESTS